MKPFFFLFLVAGLALQIPLHAAKPIPGSGENRPNIVVNAYKSSKGNWADPKNWQLKHVPTPEEDAVIRDNMTVLISSKVPDIRALSLGGQKVSTLTIADGGSLSVIEKIHVNRNDGNASSILVMDGGYLRAGADTAFVFGLMNVGTSATHSSHGIFIMNAGTFEGGINIGAVFDTATGTVSIRGVKPIVRGVVEKRDGITVTKRGTLEFIFDAEGIATMDYTKTWLRLKEGSLLRVDGTLYRGASKTFTLVDARKVTNLGTRIECVGFDPAKYEAKVSISDKNIILKIRKF